MSRFSRIVLVLCVLAGTAVLCGLGVWQLQRLGQKEALIAKVAERLKATPIPLSEAQARHGRGEDIEYLPVSVSGVFDHGNELYYFATHKGKSGWYVYTPLKLAGGRLMLVNRGFVPMERRDVATRLEGQISGEQAFIGLARMAPAAKPNTFVPDNNAQDRNFYWKSIAEMALVAGIEPDALVPFFVDVGPVPVPGGFPVGGVTLVSFPNNHLGYAITWFGLAAACAGVGGLFLFARRNRAS
jgi:surfeit locus 1 family protein